MIIQWLIFAWLLVCGIIVMRYRRQIGLAWREPVFRHPILIIESDDWGAGPLWQGERLSRLIELLGSCRDGTGRHPVMTLGLVLAIADSEAIRRNGVNSYARLQLSDERFASLMAVLKSGEQQGVFALQLHGMEHYRPASVMAAAQQDDRVRAWLTAEGIAQTEQLPAALQSRWIDAAGLPARSLSDDEINRAAAEEVDLFRHLFGRPPAVVVPPTFVWDQRVEQAWVKQGVQVIITPGRRYVSRDSAGELVPDNAAIFTGQRSSSGAVYVVRDDYFEPGLGHRAQQFIAALEHNTRLGYATLVEMHRFNFGGDQAGVEQSYRELNAALQQALAGFPGLRFMSTEELARICQTRDADWIVTDLRNRFGIWLARLRDVPGFWRWACRSGMALVILALQKIPPVAPVVK